MLGFGHPNPWVTESAPPSVPPSTVEVEDLFAYVPVTAKKGAIKVSAAGQDTVNINGQFYQLVDFTELEDIRLNAVRNIYLEGTLEHNSLSEVDSFRSMGVYVDIDYAEGYSAGQTIYGWGELVGKLYYIEFFRPVPKTENLTQTFKVVINGY